MRAALILVLALVGHGFAREMAAEWEMFKMEHGKKYADNMEDDMRYGLWTKANDYINQFNTEDHGFTLGMNQFGDLTDEEYLQYLGYNSKLRRNSTGKVFEAVTDPKDLPTSVDWRSKGYVTPIKNQAACGSCWAFSTTGSLEGQHFKKTGKLVSLSEQNLVDCSQAEGNHGCQGGLMDFGFTYIKKNGGIDTEASYPYTAKNGQCHYNPTNSGATVSGYTDVKKESEADLQEAVATVGPVSVAIDASSSSFRYYKSGVFYHLFCSHTRLDHGVLAVGYGVDGEKDYWLVKN
eukprot:scpid95074/ scgid11171/ Cathepsin L2; Cathepsin U; Cathepsin V